MIIKIALTAFILFWINVSTLKLLYDKGYDKISEALVFVGLYLASIMVVCGIIYIWQF